MSKMKKVILGITAAAVIASAGAGWYFTQQLSKMKTVLEVNTIYPGISVDGINVGGLTKDEAMKVLEDVFLKDGENKKIILSKNDKEWKFVYSDIEAVKDWKSSAEEAFAVAREGKYKERYSIYNEVQKKGFNVLANVIYNEKKLNSLIEKVEEEAFSEAKDSIIYRKDGKFVIEDEIKGFKLDTLAAKEQVEELVYEYEEGNIVLIGEETLPKITKEDNQKITSLLGSFTTRYTGGESLGRNVNLKVGSNYINGTVVADGEVFSMNEELGPQTYANGYRNAAVIVNGKLEDGIAGGVCQITTTLYNAVVNAELNIVERKNHSLAVAYVPLGQDAAVAGTYKDLKFKNNTGYPIYVEAYAQNGVLTTNIYGFEKRSKLRKIELENVYNGSIPKPPEKITEDPELPEGERIVTYEGKVGHKVSTFKKVYENNELISREWFSDSVYSPVADEVTVGTGPKKEETKPVFNNDEIEDNYDSDDDTVIHPLPQDMP